MTAAYRMRGLGWFMAVVIVALGFYLVSLQVAAERKKLDDVNGAIAEAHRQIRGLETEFSTRANLAQLERWNGTVLALAAPNADQFLHNDAQLAMIDFRPGAQQMAARNANYLVPSLPVDADRPADAATAQAQVPSPSVPVQSAAPVAAVAVAVSTPLRAPSNMPANAQVAATHARPGVIAAAATDPLPVRHGRSVAMLDRKVVNDNTLGDLLSRANIVTEHPR